MRHFRSSQVPTLRSDTIHMRSTGSGVRHPGLRPQVSQVEAPCKSPTSKPQSPYLENGDFGGRSCQSLVRGLVPISSQERVSLMQNWFPNNQQGPLICSVVRCWAVREHVSRVLHTGPASVVGSLGSGAGYHTG